MPKKLENDAEYYARMRELYILKNQIIQEKGLEEGTWVYQPWDSFYRLVFPEGFLETKGEEVDWTEPGGGKPNALLLELTFSKTVGEDGGEGIVHTRRRTVTDDLEAIGEAVKSSYANNSTVLMSPVSYFGKSRHARNARYLHAFTVDLDGVGEKQLRTLLYQMGSKFIPQASAIVNSGRGLHLWYILDSPVPLIPRMIPFLQSLKRHLTNRVWNELTSSISIDKRQYQGIYQGFRVVGTQTRLTGKTAADKRTGKYETVAFCYQPDGRQHYSSIEDLVRYVPNVSKDAKKNEISLLKALLETGGKTPLAKASKLWPDWYARRIEQGQEPGRWTVKRALYDWWLNQIRSGASVGHRYWCIYALAAYADKCGVSRKELEADAYSLFPVLSAMDETPDNRFSMADIKSALKCYASEEAHRCTRDYISRKTAIPMLPNKRNGRDRLTHLAGARAIQAINDPSYSWRNVSGAPKKDQIVAWWRFYNDEGSKAQCARETGLSRVTVTKWWDALIEDVMNPAWFPEFTEADAREWESGNELANDPKWIASMEELAEAQARRRSETEEDLAAWLEDLLNPVIIVEDDREGDD